MIKNETTFRGLMAANFVMHLISAAFAGVWIADMLAPDGNLSALDWMKTSLAVIALAIGLTYSTYLALRHLTALPQPIQGRSKIVFIVVYGVVALVLAIASGSVLAAVAGARAHMEYALNQKRDALEDRRRAASQIVNRAPLLNDCVTIAGAMSEEEVSTGAFSEAGRNVGRVAVTLRNVSTGCEVALRAVYASRANLTRLFDRAERLLIEIRQVIDGDEDEKAKSVIVRKKMEDLQRVLRAINDAFPVEAMQAAAAATSKDWFNIGLPESAAIALTGNFAGLADGVTEGLDDVSALKERKLPRMEVVPDMMYLVLYPETTMSALALGLIIELIPLATILIGFAKMSTPSENPVRVLPANSNSQPVRVVSRRGRPRRTKPEGDEVQRIA
jgi:hypothetical protein